MNIIRNIYYTGIGISTANGLYKWNIKEYKRLETLKNTNMESYNMENTYINYTGTCLAGISMGFFFGLYWPITAVGQSMIYINNILTVSKNN